jgi:P-type E1-E2 ATPase
MNTLVLSTSPQAVQKQCPHCLKAFWGNSDREQEFCCTGCERVFSLLQTCGLGLYYQNRQPLPLSPAKGPSRDFLYLDSILTFDAEENQIQLYVENIQCSSCIWVLERLPLMDPNILESKVSLMQNSIQVRFTRKILPSRIAALIRDLGYEVRYLDHAESWNKIKNERKTMLARIGVAGFAAGNTMIYAIAVYAGADASYRDWFNVLSAALYLPVFFYSSFPLYQSAIRSIASRNIGVDLPLCLALFLGSVYSYGSILLGQPHLYFDTLSSLVFLILISRFLLREIELSSKSFLYLNENAGVNPEQYRMHDQITLMSGERLNFDGVLTSTSGQIDSSWIHGESKPIPVRMGDVVPAGSKVFSHQLSFEVLRPYSETSFARQLEQARKTRLERPHYLESADRWARVFLTLILGASAILMIQGYFDRAIALLVISCPCALSLASPMTYSLSIRELFKRGIVLKSTSSLEKIARAKTIFFDKTGTLSTGQLKVVHEENLSALSLDRIRSIVYSLERSIQHPIAVSLREFVELKAGQNGIPLIEFESIEAIAGQGIEGRLKGGNRYRIQKTKSGSAFTSSELIRIEKDQSEEILARYHLQDSVRKGTFEMIFRLQEAGLQIGLLSGDHSAVVKQFATEVGIPVSRAKGDLSPSEKELFLRSHPDAIMIGDGMNDHLALSRASVGILTGNSDTELNADVIIRNEVVAGIEYLIFFSRHTFRVLDQNIAFSTLYNSAGLLAACLGYVSPLLAAILMPLSAISVFINAVIQIRFSKIGRRP